MLSYASSYGHLKTFADGWQQACQVKAPESETGCRAPYLIRASHCDRCVTLSDKRDRIGEMDGDRVRGKRRNGSILQSLMESAFFCQSVTL